MTFFSRACLAGVFCAALAALTGSVLAAESAWETHDGLYLGAMDTRVKPCDDFFRYANGRWLETSVIAADKTDSGVWSDVSERNMALLHTLAAQAAADRTASPDSPAGKIGSFYRSGMDEARIERDGAAPLAPEMARIEAVRDVSLLEAEIARLHRLAVPVGFSFAVGQDDRNSARQIPLLSQGGLDLPERGYYERTDAETVAIRRAFLAHVTRMLTLLGDSQAKAASEAGTILALETRLALLSKTPTEQRDPQANYHKMTQAEFDTLVPGVHWQPYFTALGLPQTGQMDVMQPEFFAGLGRMLTEVPLTDWKTYLRWELISAEAPRLNQALAAESFHFTHTVLEGIPKMQPRWKRVVRATDSALGEALGQLYVARAFSPEARASVQAMVATLKTAFAARLDTLDWMGPDTKAQAQAKLAAIAVKIGYPDYPRRYLGLDVRSPSYVVNGMRADEYEFQRNLAKIGQPVDRTEWGMTAPTVDAYYSQEMNDINFPAGILQPPFFSLRYDDAVNYGATGATIGHEMTHGFDDEGRQYDAQGSLNNWWTAADAANFDARALRVVAQYSAYQPLPGLHINGALTQGENIADIGGLKIAYFAFEKTLQGKPRLKIDGFSPEQRFFIAYAQSWRTKERPESEKVSLLSDPHSPSAFRVNGAVANLPEFRQAFGCPPDPKTSTATIW